MTFLKNIWYRLSYGIRIHDEDKTLDVLLIYLNDIGIQNYNSTHYKIEIKFNDEILFR